MKKLGEIIVRIIIETVIFTIAISIMLAISAAVFYAAKNIVMKNLGSWERFIEFVLISILSFMFFLFYDNNITNDNDDK